MDVLEKEQRIDIDMPVENADPHFSTDILWGEERGQMFGVLSGISAEGERVVLKAFSCQHGGEWSCPGWVEPLVDSETYLRRCREEDPKIKELTARIKELDKNSREYATLHKERKTISQNLMRELHLMYEFHNFRGEKVNIDAAWSLEKGIPSGVGDCCAPKLLNSAAKMGITPTGLVEFYWGKENRSKTKLHKHFYSACENKCQPILGFLLCGLEDE